ncbi:hypothetical protein NU219Hw_g2243t1 [Hortaea werneckii]
MLPKGVTKFLLTETTPVSLKKTMCCDASHRVDSSDRHTCTAQKGVLLFEDASFTLVHATDPIATPFIRLKPIEASREILRDHLALANTPTVRARGPGEDTLQVEKGQRGDGAKESRGEKEKEGENLASSSKMLLAKLRGEEEETQEQQRGESIAGRSLPLTRPLTTLPRAACSAQSTDSKPETIPVSDGTADTQCKDRVNPGLASELGDGESWVVLKKGDGWEGLGDEVEGDGEEEGYVDLAGK